jgi:hypothetical protein
MSIRATNSNLKKAQIKILEGKQKNTIIEAEYNPTEYSLDKSVTYGEQNLPGATTPITQFGSGAAESLSMELFFDTYENDESSRDVRIEYTNKIDELLKVDPELHAPPICEFVWGKNFRFKCVLEKASKKFTMFLPDGTPVRARVNVSLKEYEEPLWEKAEKPPQSADKTSVWRVTEGDTLWFIAAEEYGDPAQWRPIATKNGIVNPRRLDPGRELVVPPLEDQER